MIADSSLVCHQAYRIQVHREAGACRAGGPSPVPDGGGVYKAGHAAAPVCPGPRRGALPASPGAPPGAGHVGRVPLLHVRPLPLLPRPHGHGLKRQCLLRARLHACHCSRPATRAFPQWRESACCHGELRMAQRSNSNCVTISEQMELVTWLPASAQVCALRARGQCQGRHLPQQRALQGSRGGAGEPGRPGESPPQLVLQPEHCRQGL